MTERLRRRRVLLAAAGVGGLAGCLSTGPGERSPTPTDRATPTDSTPTRTAGTPEPVERVAASLQYVTPAADGRSPEVLASAERQYVVVTFGDAGVDAADTTLRLDGETYAHAFAVEREGRLDVGFEVPRDVTAAEGAVEFRDDAFPVYRDVLDRLADPPRFTETEFDVHEDVRPGGFLGLDVQTWNKGGTGPFKGVFRVPDAPPKVFSKTVDEGTLSRTSTYVTVSEDAAPGERTAVFDTGFERYARSFRVEEA